MSVEGQAPFTKQLIGVSDGARTRNFRSHSPALYL
jgi:hypothetical protein